MIGPEVKRFILLISIAMVLSACASPGKKQTSVQLTGEHLKLAALPLAELGPDYGGFVLSEKSGPKTIDQIIEDALNPDDEAADVARFSTQLGYEDVFISEQDLRDRSGVVYLADSLFLYAGRKGAVGDLPDLMFDQKRDFSGTTEVGTLQAFSTFTPKAGEKAYGSVVRVLAPGEDFGIKASVNLTITTVAFRRDRVVAQITVVRFDGIDEKKNVAEMARKLDRRLQAVMRGETPDAPEVTNQAQ